MPNDDTNLEPTSFLARLTYSTDDRVILAYLIFVGIVVALLFAPFAFLNDTLETKHFLGLTAFDVALLLCCPGGGALGMAVAKELRVYSDAPSNDLRNLERISTHLVGMALGLVVALYFVGSIQNSISSVARVIALSILLGYQAPNIWMSQEKAVKRLVDERLQEAKVEKT